MYRRVWTTRQQRQNTRWNNRFETDWHTHTPYTVHRTSHTRQHKMHTTNEQFKIKINVMKLFRLENNDLMNARKWILSILSSDEFQFSGIKLKVFLISSWTYIVHELIAISAETTHTKKTNSNNNSIVSMICSVRLYTKRN